MMTHNILGRSNAKASIAMKKPFSIGQHLAGFVASTNFQE